MSARCKDVERGYLGTRYSSGDSNTMPQPSQNKKKYREENNNEADELSEELQMGCIVDGLKRPPNICVETCVYEEESDQETGENGGEDAYSEEFEEESESEGCGKLEPKLAVSATTTQSSLRPPSTLKLSKSNSVVSSRTSSRSVSGNSRSEYGSLFIPKTHRVNMSFTNDRLREIERNNHILLGKIIDARNKKKSSIPPPEPPTPVVRHVPSAAVHRRRQQRQIDHDNMILLRKIQQAKSSSYSVRR